jgi:hypothetical protein
MPIARAIESLLTVPLDYPQSATTMESSSRAAMPDGRVHERRELDGVDDVTRFVDTRTIRRALTVLLAVGFACAFLLTSAGWETRPITSIHPIGLAVLLGIFTAVGPNAVSLFLLSHRARIAAAMVSVASVLVVAGITVDRIGLFSSFPPPILISYVEICFDLVASAALVLRFACTGIVRRNLAVPRTGSTDGADWTICTEEAHSPAGERHLVGAFELGNSALGPVRSRLVRVGPKRPVSFVQKVI